MKEKRKEVKAELFKGQFGAEIGSSGGFEQRYCS
jgi:hypothetical protein